MTFITQAIETKYLPPSYRLGARVKATAWAGSVTVHYDYGLSTEDNHRAAAEALQAKFGWQGTYAQGGNAKGDGYVFVNIEGA